jgi:hypothetical protein
MLWFGLPSTSEAASVAAGATDAGTLMPTTHDEPALFVLTFPDQLIGIDLVDTVHSFLESPFRATQKARDAAFRVCRRSPLSGAQPSLRVACSPEASLFIKSRVALKNAAFFRATCL